jgi:hypothetical protein
MALNATVFEDESLLELKMRAVLTLLGCLRSSPQQLPFLPCAQT